jgi:hypothetical protein
MLFGGANPLDLDVKKCLINNVQRPFFGLVVDAA